MLARQKARRFPLAVRGPAYPAGVNPHDGDGIRIVQVTDMHLYRDAGRTLLGVDTQRSFEEVLDRAVRERGRPDLVLATGDLVHDRSRAGYTRLRGVLAGLGVPFLWLPGNHDDPECMRAVLADAGASDPRSVRVGDWQIVLLDSTVEGSDAGRIAAAGLRDLDEDLARFPEHHALVCLHHPPVPIGSRWMDAIGLQNPAELFAVLDRHPQVRAVVCGHIHQAFDTHRGAVRILGSPSTCFQFKPRSEEFAVDRAAPGYRWLTLGADGALETGVGRIEDYSAVDIASTGY